MQCNRRIWKDVQKATNTHLPSGRKRKGPEKEQQKQAALEKEKKPGCTYCTVQTPSCRTNSLQNKKMPPQTREKNEHVQKDMRQLIGPEKKERRKIKSRRKQKRLLKQEETVPSHLSSLIKSSAHPCGFPVFLPSLPSPVPLFLYTDPVLLPCSFGRHNPYPFVPKRNIQS